MKNQRTIFTALSIAVFLAVLQFAGAVAEAQQVADPRVADFVKTGRVRAAFGMNPTIALKDPATGQLRGPALDLARALAQRIGVELVSIEYPSPGVVLQGIESKAWDLTFLVVDPGRAGVVDFSPPYMESDFTYLVPAGSHIGGVADVDRPQVRVAAVRNDASDLRLTRMLKQAVLMRADDINAAVDLVRAGQAEAAAAPRPVLLVQAGKLSGSRVLTDGFAQISYAVVVPKGNAEWFAYVSEFVEDAKQTGLVKQVIERAGLQGLQVALPRKSN